MSRQAVMSATWEVHQVALSLTILLPSKQRSPSLCTRRAECSGPLLLRSLMLSHMHCIAYTCMWSRVHGRSVTSSIRGSCCSYLSDDTDASLPQNASSSTGRRCDSVKKTIEAKMLGWWAYGKRSFTIPRITSFFLNMWTICLSASLQTSLKKGSFQIPKKCVNLHVVASVWLESFSFVNMCICYDRNACRKH